MTIMHFSNNTNKKATILAAMTKNYNGADRVPTFPLSLSEAIFNQQDPLSSLHHSIGFCVAFFCMLELGVRAFLYSS